MKRSLTNRGFTLIELIAVMGLVGAIMGGTLTLLTLIRKQQTTSEMHSQIRRDVTRLADDLRRDVEGSADVSVDHLTVVIKQSGGTVTYQVDPREITRAYQADSTRHERYRRRPGTEAAWQWNEDSRELTFRMSPYEILATKGK